MGFLGDVDNFFFEQGQDIADFLPHVLHHASNFACELYKNQPGIIYDLNYFNKGLWEKLCRRRPPGLPPAPAPDFLGGQCLVFYFLRYKNPAGTVIVASGNPIQGAIKSVRLAWAQHPRTGTWGWKFFVRAPDVINAEKVGDEFFINGSATFNDPAVRPDRQPEFLDFIRQDGQPDNCGNPPVPPVVPVIIPPQQRTTNITYTFDDGVQVTVPVLLVFPTLNNTFKIAPSLTLEFNANVSVPINIHLLPDGFHSEPDDEIKDDGDSGDNLDYYFYPPNPDEDPLVKPTPPTPPASFQADDDISGARWLRIELTKLPDKAHYGTGTPNVYFAGWIEFTKGGDCLPRQQVNFQKSLFRFPDGADGYYVQFANGAKGRVIVYAEDSDA